MNAQLVNTECCWCTERTYVHTTAEVSMLILKLYSSNLKTHGHVLQYCCNPLATGFGPVCPCAAYCSSGQRAPQFHKKKFYEYHTQREVQQQYLMKKNRSYFTENYGGTYESRVGVCFILYRSEKLKNCKEGRCIKSAQIYWS